MTDGLMWAPGWFPDPTGRHDHRWWDGAAWTAHVADGGVAAFDAIDAVDGPGRSGPAAVPGPSGRHVRGAITPSGGNDPVAISAIAVGITALPLSLVPGLGLVPAATAVALGLVARSRITGSGRSGGGLAIAGLTMGLIALLLALLATVFSAMVLGGSGGELAGAFREYVACLDVRSQQECRVLLEEALTRMVE